MPAIPIITLVVAAGSAIYSGVAASNQANNEEEQQRLNNESTMKAAVESYGDLTPKERDADKEAAAGGIKAQSDYLRSVGEMNVMSGASGTYGGSIDSMLRDLKTTRGRNISDVVANRTTELDNVRAQAEQIRYGARANMQTRVFSKPSAVGTGLSAVGAGAQGYATGRTIQKGLEEGSTAISSGQ
jgi:hypothetical protein